MIKALVKGNGRRLIVLGLSAQNVSLLQQGRDIVLPNVCEQAGLDILLLYVENENDAVAALEKRGFELPSDPDKIQIDPKLGG